MLFLNRNLIYLKWKYFDCLFAISALSYISLFYIILCYKTFDMFCILLGDDRRLLDRLNKIK
jgi:hypothetical protein